MIKGKIANNSVHNKTMKRIAIPLLAILMTASCSNQQVFFHDDRGLFHGPYQIKRGKTFRLGGGIFTVLTPTRNQLAFQNRIEKIIIPEIDFEEASICEVIEFLQDSITEQTGGGNCGIQLALTLDDFTKNPFSNSAEDSEPPLCTMSVKQITLLSAMDLIAELTAMTYKVSENKILFSPKYTRPAQQF